MEEKTSLIPISSFDMLEHNQVLKEHKILLEDCRSLLKFNNKQVKDVEKELYLFNDYIKIIFQFLKDIKLFDFEFNFEFNLKGHSSCLTSYEIMSNEFNWSFIIEIEFNSIIDLNLPFDIIDILEMDLIKKIKENHLIFKLSYFEIKIKFKNTVENTTKINDIKIIDNKFIDIYGIMKNVKTFTQRDDNIRQKIYQILFNETKEETKDKLKPNILFIGGEFYGFMKILFNNYNIAYGMTDFKGIKEDAEYNNPNIKVDLVNYDTFTFDKEPKMIEIQFDICIVNLLNGLGYNLIKELKKIKTLKKIIIISCKPKATQKDIKFIEEELKEFKLSLTDIYNLETTRQTLQIYIFKNT